MTQQLRLKQEFQQLLQTYQASKQSQKLLRQAKIALFNGPTASGRNTIMNSLVATRNYQLMLSDTTRAPRLNNGILEKNGVEYWFKSEEEFLEGLRQGQYIEAAIIHEQQVSGVNIAEINRAVTSGKMVVNDVQPDGIEAFRRYNPNTTCFFVIPPDFRTWESRLNARGEMTKLEKKRRYTSSVQEIEHALDAQYYQFIVNDNLTVAVEKVDAICKNTHVDTTVSRKVAESLLQETRAHLKTIA